MKIHFVINSLVSGGAERVVSNLANHFASLGYQVSVFIYSNQSVAYELHPDISFLHYKKSLPLLNLASIKCFFHLLKFYAKKEHRPDVLNSHMSSIGFGTIPISKIYKIPLVVTEHTNHIESRKSLVNKFIYLFYGWVTAITVLTNFDLKYFKKKNKNTFVIPNPCSFGPLKEYSSKREKVFLVLGNLDRYHEKGFDSLIHIMASILPEYPDWKLKIIGEGLEGEKVLKSLVRQNKLENQVTFLGFRTDVEEIMKRSEIFLLTSKFEGLPMALLEAMSQGMVCIAYNCISGPSDIIDHPRNGILVQDQNEELMIAEIKKIVESSKVRDAIRKETKSATSKYSKERIGNLWLQLFNNIANH